MGILTDEMQHALTEQRLIFVATVCPDGTPNLSPKGTVMVWDDDHILFTDLASPGTMRNGPSTLNGLDSRVRSVALIRVEQALPLVSPGYWGGATESQMRRTWQEYWSGVNSAWHENQAGAQAADS